MFFKKIWKKITNKKEYQYLKSIESNKKNNEEFKVKFEPYINNIQKKIKSQKELSILHSGHSGDIINALPVIKELSKTHLCNLYININKPLNNIYYNHPGKDVFINEKIFNILLPLLKNQNFINKIDRHKSEKIDINFDIFRELPINISFDNLRYSFQIAGIQPDIDAPYLEADSHDKIKNKIIVQRTFRYRNQFINYKFLNNYKEIYFVGTFK